MVRVNLRFLDHPQVSGIFNVGTGRYQSFTEADLNPLRSAGYEAPFLSVEEGVARYMEWLREQPVL